MSRTLIKDAMVVNEGLVQRASVLIENDTIAGILRPPMPPRPIPLSMPQESGSCPE